MPELPEVHTTVEGLKSVVLGKQIKSVWSDYYLNTAHGQRQTVKNKKYFNKFKRAVTGAKIKSLTRVGKNIILSLNNGSSIIVHLKMTGCLMYKKVPEDKYVHLIFTFASGDYMLLSDLRKFASVTFCPTESLHLHPAVGKLGLDPLSPEFSAEKFFDLIHSQKNVPIKSALLNQARLAGIGNIYSDEILWQTSIHPLSAADKIPQKKFAEIFKVTRQILKFSIKHGGDSKSDYRNAFGEKGGFQNFHKVYGKKGAKCPKAGCSGIIERTTVRGRSAHFCPRHQVKYK